MLLKAGGYMVYSTCSLTRSQNESVVSWLLEREPSATLVEVPFAAKWTATAASGENPPWEAGGLAHTLRFSARTGTSGLFVARIRKGDVVG